jgi:hypothetical protein
MEELFRIIRHGVRVVELSDSAECREFLDQLSYYQFSNNIAVSGKLDARKEMNPS